MIAHQFPKAPVAVAWLLAVLIAGPAIWLAARLARWFGTSLVVTDRRIVFRSGVLGRRVVNLRLQRVVDTHCTQRPLERLIGSGTIVLEVEGEEGGLALDDVRRPRTLQRVINRQLSQMDANWQANRAPAPERPRRARGPRATGADPALGGAHGGGEAILDPRSADCARPAAPPGDPLRRGVLREEGGTPAFASKGGSVRFIVWVCVLSGVDMGVVLF